MYSCAVSLPSGQQNSHTMLMFTTIYLPVPSTYQTGLQVMINYTLNFNKAFQSMPTTSPAFKQIWAVQAICKHQMCGVEILTKNANPLVTATTVPPPVL